MNVLSLFSGIGGLDLGLERAGMTVVGQVEIDPLRRAILTRHWPNVPQHDDVTTFADWWQQEERPRVHLVAGGPPCQPFSWAGFGLGVNDDRWMWPAMASAIRLVRPRFVLVENVPALLVRRDAFGWILSDLASLGFDAEWTVLSACALGAPQVRRRLLLVAYTNEVDGDARLGPEFRRCRTIPGFGDIARAWRDQVDRAVAASPGDPRDADGLAPELVAAGGDAVVPAVAEYIGRQLLEYLAAAA
jgi:DNA (cytosine-5)-methyltransferase 1